MIFIRLVSIAKCNLESDRNIPRINSRDMKERKLIMFLGFPSHVLGHDPLTDFSITEILLSIASVDYRHPWRNLGSHNHKAITLSTLEIDANSAPYRINLAQSQRITFSSSWTCYHIEIGKGPIGSIAFHLPRFSTANHRAWVRSSGGAYHSLGGFLDSCAVVCRYDILSIKPWPLKWQPSRRMIFRASLSLLCSDISLF